VGKNVNQDGMTMGEIGEELGISRERVRQIIQKALKKMRRHISKDLLTDLGGINNRPGREDPHLFSAPQQLTNRKG